jgi:hypothetical protein
MTQMTTSRFDEFDDKPANVPETIYLPCGASAHFCYEAGYGYRCEDCMAVVGSIAQPRHCVDASEKYSIVLKELGSNIRWNYETGCEYEENNRNRDEY